jgi:UPF0271 protein
MIVDLNCDLGEGGPADAELMVGCTSVNLAAGGHAGGGRLLEEAVARARAAGVAIGAHPGYEDRANFGRVDLPLAPGDIAASVRWQVEAVRALAPLRHVKPHGALYNRAARDPEAARAIAEAVAAVDPALRLFGLAGGAQEAAAKACGLSFVAEGFVDRGYEADGRLTPRGRPGALLETVDAAVGQALRLVREGVRSGAVPGGTPVRVATLCVHGDGVAAAALLRAVRAALLDAGVRLAAP